MELGDADKVINGDSLFLILRQHRLNDLPEVVRVARWNSLIGAFFNFEGESELVLSLERRSEGR